MTSDRFLPAGHPGSAGPDSAGKVPPDVADLDADMAGTADVADGGSQDLARVLGGKVLTVAGRGPGGAQPPSGYTQPMLPGWEGQ